MGKDGFICYLHDTCSDELFGAEELLEVVHLEEAAAEEEQELEDRPDEDAAVGRRGGVVERLLAALQRLQLAADDSDAQLRAVGGLLELLDLVDAGDLVGVGAVEEVDFQILHWNVRERRSVSPWSGVHVRQTSVRVLWVWLYSKGEMFGKCLLKAEMSFFFFSCFHFGEFVVTIVLAKKRRNTMVISEPKIPTEMTGVMQILCSPLVCV